MGFAAFAKAQHGSADFQFHVLLEFNGARELFGMTKKIALFGSGCVILSDERAAPLFELDYQILLHPSPSPLLVPTNSWFPE